MNAANRVQGEHKQYDRNHKGSVLELWLSSKKSAHQIEVKSVFQMPFFNEIFLKFHYDIKLSGSDVHIWLFSLDMKSDLLNTSLLTLSADEQDRAKKFKFDIDRDRYVTGRFFLRQCLSRYLQIPSNVLRFNYGPTGKPALKKEFNEDGIEFNLAHSDNLALLAITKAGVIGADIELLRPIPNMVELIKEFSSFEEFKIFQTLPTEYRVDAFFRLWTRKEAFLKATGDGIGHLLRKISMSFSQNEQIDIIKIDGCISDTKMWRLHDLSITGYFGAAIAVKSLKPINVFLYRSNIEQLTC